MKCPPKQVTVLFADLTGSMELAQSYATGRLTTSARPRRLLAEAYLVGITEAESDPLSS